METLKLLSDYFPTSVFTGRCLVFVSEEWRVELTEHKDENFSEPAKKPVIDVPKGNILPPGTLIRVRIFKKALNGEFVPGHYEDFQLASLSELATQIEKYIQFAIGKNIRENV